MNRIDRFSPFHTKSNFFFCRLFYLFQIWFKLNTVSCAFLLLLLIWHAIWNAFAIPMPYFIPLLITGTLSLATPDFVFIKQTLHLQTLRDHPFQHLLFCHLFLLRRRHRVVFFVLIKHFTLASSALLFHSRNHSSQFLFPSFFVFGRPSPKTETLFQPLFNFGRVKCARLSFDCFYFIDRDHLPTRFRRFHCLNKNSIALARSFFFFWSTMKQLSRFVFIWTRRNCAIACFINYRHFIAHVQINWLTKFAFPSAPFDQCDHSVSSVAFSLGPSSAHRVRSSRSDQLLRSALGSWRHDLSSVRLRRSRVRVRLRA